MRPLKVPSTTKAVAATKQTADKCKPKLLNAVDMQLTFIELPGLYTSSCTDAYTSADVLQALSHATKPVLTICCKAIKLEGSGVQRYTETTSSTNTLKGEFESEEELDKRMSELTLQPAPQPTSCNSIVLQFKATESNPSIKLKLKKKTIAAHPEVLKSLDVKAGVQYQFVIHPLKDTQPCQELHLQGVLSTLSTDKEVLKEVSPTIEWWEKLKDAPHVQNYLTHCLHGSLLFPTNYIRISLHGVSLPLQVARCVATSDGTNNEDMVQPLVPFRVNCDTQIYLNFSPLLKNQHNIQQPNECNDKKRIGLERMGGLKSVLEDLKLYVILPLCRPDVFERYGLEPPKGILLYGPPGSGKTHLVRCLAEELTSVKHMRNPVNGGVPPHVELLLATDLISSTIGGTTANINAIFNRASMRKSQMNQNTLLFIDEIDAICPNRIDASESGKRAVATFLNCLDGLRSDRSLILIGATNHPNSIDPAIRRAGRLEREIEIGVPSTEDRYAILKLLLEPIPHDLNHKQIEEISDLCTAFVGADLRLLISTAAFIALENDYKELKGDASNLALDEEYIDMHMTHSRIKFQHIKKALQFVKPSAMKELLAEVPHVPWSSIGGYSKVKEKLRECVEWPYKYKNAFEKLHLNPPRGILLYGPPGCSKTMMAKAVATESRMNFISIKGPEIFSKWVGESERTIRELFRKARQNSPCVVFFDEVDALGVDRGSSSGGVSSRVLSQLLNEMDGIGPLKEVVVIGATNRPDIIDSALMRPGRFDRLIYIPLPDVDARLEIFKGQLQKMPIEYTSFNNICMNMMRGVEEEQQSLDIICMDFAKQTDGYSGAEIVLVCREAAMCTLKEKIDRAEMAAIQRYNALSDEAQVDGLYNILSHNEEVDVSMDEVIAVKHLHFQSALESVTPRISMATIKYYEAYESQQNKR